MHTNPQPFNDVMKGHDRLKKELPPVLNDLEQTFPGLLGIVDEDRQATAPFRNTTMMP